MAALTGVLLEGIIAGIRQQSGIKTNKDFSIGGSAAVDLSASSGIFKTPTGVNTFGGSSNVFTNAPTGPQIRATSSSALAGATVVLTAADSGKVFINRSTSGAPSWTLPTLADGLLYTFICANTTAGFTVTGAQVIQFKTTATGTALSSTTTLTNTQGTAVVGDTITIVGDATANTWKMIAQSGIFAAS